MSLLTIDGLAKRFGGHDALKDIWLTVEPGEFIALLGPSGCGKTTLLRCIAGFLSPDTGRIAIDGEDMTRLPAHRRPLNTVFQNYALFPHMTVLENVAYGPRRQGAGRKEAAAKAAEALSLVGLADLGNRQPRQLSGGQQQRVALARAIVNRPKLLLLDEPLSALDLKLRKRMQFELKELQEKLGIAFIFVTHDQEEAMTMADRVVVMNAGRIEQEGAGDDIYRAPASRFVAEFIGEANLISAEPVGPGLVRLSISAEPVAAETAGSARQVAVLRPEHVEILPDVSAIDVLITAAGTVVAVSSVGSHTIIHIRLGDEVISARRLGLAGGSPSVGKTVRIGFRPEHLHLVAE
jgi:spermidine/putrescine transport system ATP-binding protein